MNLEEDHNSTSEENTRFYFHKNDHLCKSNMCHMSQTLYLKKEMNLELIE